VNRDTIHPLDLEKTVDNLPRQTRNTKRIQAASRLAQHHPRIGTPVGYGNAGDTHGLSLIIQRANCAPDPIAL